MTPAIEFVSHASFVLDSGAGVRLLADPWLDGLVFNQGWSLLSPVSFSEADFESITHLWFSHEHPDHFHPPTLKRIPESRRAQITVLYQSSPDLAATHEIKAFCARLGFRAFVDLPPDRPFALGASLEMRCRPHMWGDSWCHLRVAARPGARAWTIFNANDCEWERPEVAEPVFAEVGPVDVLLMQFSYACWYPNRAARRREADRLIERLVMMTKASGARYVIPFASFVWFCHEENREINDEMNSIHRAAEAVATRTSARPVVLYPGDRWEIGADSDGAAALQRYAQDYERVKSQPAVRGKAPIALDDLRRKLTAFWDRNRLPGDEDPSGPDLRLFLRDLGTAALWKGAELAALDVPESGCDIALSTDSLAFLLDTRWGTSTLGINARYALPAGSRFESLSAIELAVVRALGRRHWLVAGPMETTAYGVVPAV